jgi:hypothetical protein
MMLLRLGDPGELALFLSLGALFLGLFFGPIGQAIGRRITGGKAKSDPATGLTTGEMTAERVAALEDRIAELESERGLLEERLDFAERMLSQAGESRAIEPGRRA